MTSAEDIKFRCSSLGDIMSGVAKGWKVEDSLTCKRKLVEIYREKKYSRRSSFSNKYTQKGTKMEEDAITLYSRFRKQVFAKNSERKENDYITGEWDIFIPGETIDIKCAWSLDTLPHSLTDKPDQDYIYQGDGYMDLTGSKKHTIAYCLVNAPSNLIVNEKKKLFYEMGCPEESSKAFIDKCIQIEKNMIFDMDQFISDNPGFDFDCKDWEFDMPMKERIVEFTLEKNAINIEKIYKRIKEGREWMNKNLFKLEAALAV